MSVPRFYCSDACKAKGQLKVASARHKREYEKLRTKRICAYFGVPFPLAKDEEICRICGVVFKRRKGKIYCDRACNNKAADRKFKAKFDAMLASPENYRVKKHPWFLKMLERKAGSPEAYEAKLRELKILAARNESLKKSQISLNKVLTLTSKEQ